MENLISMATFKKSRSVTGAASGIGAFMPPPRRSGLRSRPRGATRRPLRGPLDKVLETILAPTLR